MKKINKICNVVFNNTPIYIRRYIIDIARVLFFKKNPKSGFVIITQSRSGSSLLIDLLNSHPKITAYNNIFNTNFARNIKKPFIFAQGIFTLANTQICGFKVRLKDMKEQGIEPSQFINEFHKNNWKFIHLQRKNLVRKTISNLMLEKTGREVILKTTQPKKININTKKFFKFIKEQELALEKESELLKNIKHHKISYEESLLNNKQHQKTLNELFCFLNVQPHSVKTKIKKQGKANLKEYILNYAELESILRNTKYYRLLTSK